MRMIFSLLASMLAGSLAVPAHAEQLYNGNRFANIASDNRARAIGDIVTVVIYETASATNRVSNRSGKSTSFSGGIGVGGINESADLSLGGSYDGTGEVERSDRLIATMAARVMEILPNGDLLVEGQQNLFVNGEKRNITVRGQVRQVDISAENMVASNRLANAEINYDGEGFVSRSAKPGLINRILGFLGLG